VVVSFDKAYGCLAGLILGDALGMPTEFLTPEQIEAEYGTIAGLVAAADWHPHSALPFGSVTDDTGQALALADVYVRGEPMTAEAAARAIVSWAETSGERFDLFAGPSTKRAVDVLRCGASPRESGLHGVTNGAAMRVAPIGIVHAGDLEAALADAVEACMPTHGTMLAISGATAVASAVCEAMTEGATVESVLEAAARGAAAGRKHGAWVWTPLLEERIALALRLVREAADDVEARRALYRYVGVDISVAESVATAFGLVALAKGDPMRAVLHAAQIGGDTDTIGAIAGAVCGALSGVGAIDAEMLATVEGVNGLALAEVARGLVAEAEKRSVEGGAGRV
jgi:ADP-ribosylglycohydrolase